MQEDTTAIKAKGVVKSVQEGVYSGGGLIPINRVAHGVTDVLLAPISTIDASKAILCSPVKDSSDNSHRTTQYPIVKNDGVYLRHINNEADSGTYSLVIDSFYWKVVEIY